MASSTGTGDGGTQNPITVLSGVVKFILRAAPGLTEAEQTGQGSTVSKAGFYVSHNADARTRAVFVEALGYGGKEQQMLTRYKTAIGRALNATLGVNADAHVTVLPAGMVRISGLSNEQIARLRERYSA
ncbi:MAG TPA: hypothetical protein VJM46_02230 [Candidatus Saccharimonadales bacterium]|nr:hypothetical protein [Candidatus Saccharimonadales bacterium]